MPAATSQTYNVATGVMYTDCISMKQGDTAVPFAQPKYASVTRTIPNNATVVETVQTKVTTTADGDSTHVNDVAGQYSSVTVTNLPTQPRLNY